MRRIAGASQRFWRLITATPDRMNPQPSIMNKSGASPNSKTETFANPAANLRTAGTSGGPAKMPFAFDIHS